MQFQSNLEQAIGKMNIPYLLAYHQECHQDGDTCLLCGETDPQDRIHLLPKTIYKSQPKQTTRLLKSLFRVKVCTSCKDLKKHFSLTKLREGLVFDHTIFLRQKNQNKSKIIRRISYLLPYWE